MHYLHSIIYFSVVCFVLNTVYTSKSKSKTFTELLLIGLVIKFLLAFIVIIIYSIVNKPNFFYFSIHFISHYILFTIFEIRYLLQLIKINQPKNTLHEK
jgi:cobalamin biosynthesis protein CobD/CbiB